MKRSILVTGANSGFEDFSVKNELEFNTISSADSEFNCATFDSILSFIKESIISNITGIFNAVGSSNIQLNDLRKYFSSNVKFGKFNYQTGIILNKKICCVEEIFKFSFLQMLMLFLEKKF